MTNVRLVNVGYGVYEVRSRATGVLLGRVARGGRNDKQWLAFVIRAHGYLGTFWTRRDAVSEVLIYREAD